MSISCSEAFWFPTGNFVIIASSTAFKVHRALLTQHTDVFDAMLTAQQQDLFEGCPCVELRETASDMIHFFNVVYDELYVFETRHFPRLTLTSS